MIINRTLLKVKIKKKPIKSNLLKKHLDAFISSNNISKEEASYFVFSGEISNQAYGRNNKNKSPVPPNSAASRDGTRSGTKKFTKSKNIKPRINTINKIIN